MGMTVRSVYNTKTVHTMPQSEKEKILNAGVPIEFYTKGYLDLGPRNSRSLARFASVLTQIYLEDLPLPPSPLVEYIVERTCGESKQDFSATLEGKKGAGKSRSTMYKGARYGYEVAQRLGGEPTDYFSESNCALLEDTEAIADIMKNTGKHQFIAIDDASVALGSRDFAQEKNKNFNKLLTTCRTRRWVVVLNVPMASHLDLQIRELVDAKMNVHKSFHAGGFNVLKVYMSDIMYRLNKKQVFEKFFRYRNRKFDFWGAFSPDLIPGYEGFTERYEKQRDAATTRIIEEHADDAHEKKDTRSKAEKKWEQIRNDYYDKVKHLMHDPDMIIKGVPSSSKIQLKVGLSREHLRRLMGEIAQDESDGKVGNVGNGGAT